MKDFNFYKKWALNHLKKQLEKETIVEKAIEFCELRLEKAFPVGTVRTWKGKKYKKMPNGKWVRFYDKSGRGTNQAIRNVMRKIEALEDGDIQGLMSIIQQNSERFRDINGHALPEVQELYKLSQKIQGKWENKEDPYKKMQDEIKREEERKKQLAAELERKKEERITDFYATTGLLEMPFKNISKSKMGPADNDAFFRIGEGYRDRIRVYKKSNGYNSIKSIVITSDLLDRIITQMSDETFEEYKNNPTMLRYAMLKELSMTISGSYSLAYASTNIISDKEFTNRFYVVNSFPEEESENNDIFANVKEEEIDYEKPLDVSKSVKENIPELQKRLDIVLNMLEDQKKDVDKQIDKYKAKGKWKDYEDYHKAQKEENTLTAALKTIRQRLNEAYKNNETSVIQEFKEKEEKYRQEMLLYYYKKLGLKKDLGSTFKKIERLQLQNERIENDLKEYKNINLDEIIIDDETMLKRLRSFCDPWYHTGDEFFMLKNYLNHRTNDEIAGVKQGYPMDFSHADSGHTNPNFSLGGKYRVNCQSCVPVFIARMRGYNIEVLPKGETGSELSRDTRLAWIDPKTGKKPEPVYFNANRKTEFFEALEDRIGEGQQWAVEYAYAGKHCGHILTFMKVYGKLYMFDPQSGTITNDRQKIEDHIPAIKLSNETTFGYRLDNLRFNYEKLNGISKGSNETV